MRLPRISSGYGGAVELTCDDAWLTGRYTSFVNTKKGPTFGLGKELKVAKENGRVQRVWFGQVSPPVRIRERWLRTKHMWCWDNDSSLHWYTGVGYNSQKVWTSTWPEFCRCQIDHNSSQWIDRSMRERQESLPRTMHFFGKYALHARGPLPATQPRLSVCGWLAARVCEALWYWVVKEVGQVFSLSNDIELTVTTRYKQGG